MPVIRAPAEETRNVTDGLNWFQRKPAIKLANIVHKLPSPV